MVKKGKGKKQIPVSPKTPEIEIKDLPAGLENPSENPTREESNACDGICIECDQCPCETIVNDWGRLQQILDSTDDIEDKVAFLQTLISRNKFLCYKGECPIFSDMIELRGQLADFDLPITSLQEIQQKNLTGEQRKILFEKYKRARYSCDKLLQKIMRVAQTNKANEMRDETAHRRRLELIDKLNESHFPLPMDVKSDIEQQLNMSNAPENWQQAQADKVKEASKEKKPGDKNGKDTSGIKSPAIPAKH